MERRRIGTAALLAAWAGWAAAAGVPLPVLGVLGTVGALGLGAVRVARRAGPRSAVQQGADQRPGPLPGLSPDLLPLAAVRTDGQGRIVALNRGWEDLAGRPAAETLGHRVWDFLHPQDLPAARAAWQPLLEGSQRHGSGEWRLLDAAGRPVQVAVRLRATALAGEAAPAGSVATVEVITRHRRADAGAASRRGEVGALLANVPGLVYRSRNDRAYTMEFISEGCLELTGHAPEDLIGNRRLAFGDLVHPQDREYLWSRIQARLARREVYQVTYRIVDAHGQTRWVWEQGRGVFASQGELLAIEGFITDLDERRGAEEQARRRLWFEARTGLSSRAVFDALLAWAQQQARAGGACCTLLVIDVDVDDGAPADEEGAEQALTLLARRLGAALGPGAQAARLGPRRFAALVHDLRLLGVAAPVAEPRALIAAAARLAQDLAVRLAAPLPEGAGPHGAVAIGIAFTQARYADADALLQAAGAAARQAAALGPGHCEFADE